MDKNPQPSPNCPGTSSSEKGTHPACEGCPNKTICKSGQTPPKDPTIDIVRDKLSTVKNIILILSGKGGVGKSTISSQLALSLSQNFPSLEIGILDIDICSPSIPRMLSLENEEVHQSSEGWTPIYRNDNLAVMSIGFLLQDNKTPVIWRGPRKNGMIKEFLTLVAWEKLDYLIIDTPPGTSDEHLTIVNYLKEANVKGAIVVTTPQEVSLLAVRKEINFCRKTGLNVIGVVENMSGFICQHCGKESEIFVGNTGGARKMCEEFGVKLIAKIPLEPLVVQACERGVGIEKEFPQSETSKEIKKVVDEIIALK